MKKETHTIFWLLLLVGAMFVLSKHHKKQQAVISVYIHGTLFNWRNMLATIPGAADLVYVPDGLSLVKDLPENTVGNKLAVEFSKRDPRRFVYDNFYTFGWNGKLSFEHRKKSAEFLAKELTLLVNKYKHDYGIKPIVRLVTFSHGGNVALNLAHYLPQGISVELILIACPIQPETEDLILADCFSKVYMIFSLNDVIQVSDPQNIYQNIKNKKDYQQWLSKRYFNHDIDKLKQACVSVNGTYLGHLEMFQLFNQHIPKVLNRLDVLSGVTGTTVGYVDVEDKGFPFLHGLNIVDVLQGIRDDEESLF